MAVKCNMVPWRVSQSRKRILGGGKKKQGNLNKAWTLVNDVSISVHSLSHTVLMLNVNNQGNWVYVLLAQFLYYHPNYFVNLKLKNKV